MNFAGSKLEGLIGVVWFGRWLGAIWCAGRWAFFGVGLLVGGLLFGEEGASPEVPAQWDFSFELRFWYARAGLEFENTEGVSSEGRAWAPQVAVEALRNRWLFATNVQLKTPFDGQQRLGPNRFDFSVDRSDIELAMGYELRPRPVGKGMDWVPRVVLGYKALALEEDDVTTIQTNKDFEKVWKGLFAGFTGIWRGTFARVYDWDVSLRVAYALLDARISQADTPMRSFVTAYSFAADGLYLDFSFNVYLPVNRVDLLWMVGYKGQWYDPRPDAVDAFRVIRHLDGSERREPVRPITQVFRSDGWISGLLLRF